MKKPVVAIDGYSSTGKSSISKMIAEKLDLVHIDTGALYRGITLFAIQNYLNSDYQIDFLALLQNLNKIHLEFKNENGALSIYLNGKNIDKEIREPKIADYVSDVAKIQEVRDFLLDTQRKSAEKGGVIMDGRDIGTVVLPNADFKFFLTASIEERTKRRYLELKGQNVDIDIETVRLNLITRDKIDSERVIAPLKQAEDAILIDNSTITKEETADLIISYIKS